MNTEKYFNTDKDLTPIAGGSAVTPVTEYGSRGEALYTVKTAYTDITVDGKKDPAYDYGVHLRGLYAEHPEYYNDRATDIDVYMVRGQNGRLYVYGEVTDPEVFVKEELFNGYIDYNDSIVFYLDYENYGFGMDRVGRIVAFEGGTTYSRKIADSVVKLTEKGFNFEFSTDNKGKPFGHGDHVGFSLYYRDTNNFKDVTDCECNLTKLTAVLDIENKLFPVPRYQWADGSHTDSILFSEDSVSGKDYVSSDRPKKNLTGDMMKDILFGGASVAVVVGDRHSAVQTIFGAMDIQKALEGMGADATLTRRYGVKTYDYEIVFNSYEANGGNMLYNSLDCNEYGIAFEEKRILLSSPLEKGAEIIKKELIARFERVKNGESSETVATPFYGVVEGIVTNGIPKPRRLDHYTDVGDGAYLMMTIGASQSDYVDYIAKLVRGGFTLHAENQMGSIVCATYYGKGAVINVTYSPKYDNSLRVVVEPISNTALPALEPENNERKVTPKLTMVAPNNLCMVYRLSNGEFVILDSGSGNLQKPIYDVLMEQSDGNPVVAAWMFSHFHQDHTGGFVSLVEDDERLKDVTIKSVIYNWPQKLVKDTSLYWVDQANLAKWESLIDKTGAQRYQARTGQKFHFGDAVIDVLWTYEDIMPYNLFNDDTNVTCSGYQLTIAGQKHMLLGDTCHEEMHTAYNRLGDYLKSNLVQLAHHGWGSWISPIEFYNTVGAPIVYLPGTRSILATGGKAERETAANAKVLFIREDGTKTIDLPYII